MWEEVVQWLGTLWLSIREYCVVYAFCHRQDIDDAMVFLFVASLMLYLFICVRLALHIAAICRDRSLFEKIVTLRHGVVYCALLLTVAILATIGSRLCAVHVRFTNIPDSFMLRIGHWTHCDKDTQSLAAHIPDYQDRWDPMNGTVARPWDNLAFIKEDGTLLRIVDIKHMIEANMAIPMDKQIIHILMQDPIAGCTCTLPVDVIDELVILDYSEHLRWKPPGQCAVTEWALVLDLFHIDSCR